MKATSFKPTHVLGIDVAKKSYQVALANRDDPETTLDRNFENNTKGHRALLAWLSKHGTPSQIHACMEATGPCGDELALFLDKHLGAFSLEQPRRIKGYARCRMMRSKSDPADARMIAHYCATQKPRTWKRPSDGQLQLRAASRRRDCLLVQIQGEENRLEQTSDRFVRKDIKAHLRHLQQRLASTEEQITKAIKADAKLSKDLDLLVSIRGIGVCSGAIILAEITDTDELASARQLAAYAGVTPRHHQTGTSGTTHTPMSKNGSSRLRKALFYPAMSAMRYNPACKAFAERLQAKGKKQIVILGAIMTKLLHIIYGVLKSQKPFDPQHHLKFQPETAEA